MRIIHILFIYIIINLLSQQVSGQDLLQWRGVDRSGFFESSELLDEWPDEGPNLILQVDDLPKSYSSVIKKGNILYTTGIEEPNEILTAISMDGKILWNTKYGDSWTNSFPNARCTPTIEGDYAYLISGNGDVASVNINDGKLMWIVKGQRAFSGSHGSWGYAESPLIVDDKIFFTPGGDKTTIVALDKFTGETIWKSESLNDNSAYCSPVLIDKDGIKMITTVTANYIIGVSAETGDIFWYYEYGKLNPPDRGGDINPVTPLVKGNEVFVTSGYNHIGVMLSIADDMRSVKLKWKTEDLDVHHGGVVNHKGYIYGANYTSIVAGNWLCLDWETGQLQYDHDWHGKGSIILADDKLICYDERRGNVALVKADPKQFNLISSFRIKPGSGPHWSHPTIYDNFLLMRHGQALMVFDIGIKKADIAK